MCVPTRSVGEHTRQQTVHCGQAALDYQSRISLVPPRAPHPEMPHPAMLSPRATRFPQLLRSQSLVCLQEAALLTTRLRSRAVS